jgi:predicted XRE-type DNA-binding protein
MADEPDDPDDLDSPDESLPVLPGFREMALRRASGERSRLLAELAARRQASGLSQTEIAARMGTSQSAVARLEAGVNDVRLSTLQRYAAAVGSHLSLRVQAENVGEKE